jgi:hypothetical protein
VGSQTAKRRRPPCWDLVPKRGWEDIMNRRVSPRGSNVRERYKVHEKQSSLHSSACRDKRPRGLWVTGTGIFRGQSLRLK